MRVGTGVGVGVIKESACACAVGGGAIGGVGSWGRREDEVMSVESVVEDRIDSAGGSTVLYNVEH